MAGWFAVSSGAGLGSRQKFDVDNAVVVDYMGTSLWRVGWSLHDTLRVWTSGFYLRVLQLFYPTVDLIVSGSSLYVIGGPASLSRVVRPMES